MNKARQAALNKLRGLKTSSSEEPSTPQIAPAAPPPPVADSASSPSPQNRGGRPPADTAQISLRPSKAAMSFLRRRPVEATIAEDRTVSPQQIILRLIDAEMAREKDGPHG